MLLSLAILHDDSIEVVTRTTYLNLEVGVWAEKFHHWTRNPQGIWKKRPLIPENKSAAKNWKIEKETLFYKESNEAWKPIPLPKPTFTKEAKYLPRVVYEVSHKDVWVGATFVENNDIIREQNAELSQSVSAWLRTLRPAQIL